MIRKDKAEEIRKKEKTIHNLKKSKTNLRKENQSLKSANGTLVDILIKSQHNTLVKVFEDLSSKELKEKSFLQISKGDVLFVKDPKIISKTTKKTLDSLDLTVITSKRPSLNAIFIPESEIEFLNDHHFFLLIDTKRFRKALTRQDLIGQIVDDYRRTR